MTPVDIDYARVFIAGIEDPERSALREAVLVLLMRRVFLDCGARQGMEHLAALASVTCDSVYPPSPPQPPASQAPRLRVVT
jgi:hypothetical protein